jgi:hypothetical protein
MDEVAELAGLLEAGWQSSLEGRVGVGWDSNLLLSGGGRTQESSGFGSAKVEGMLWRPAGELRPVEVVSFLSATYRRMFSAGTLPDDAEAFFQGEARWRPASPFRLSLLAQGYYFDTVIDLSTESERLASPLRNAGFNTGVVARWETAARWWLEATATVGRSYFHLIPEDYQESRLGVRAGWQSASGRLKLGTGVRETDRRYRERNATAIGGRPIAGTRLRYRMPEFEVNLEQLADWRGHWRFTGTLAGSRNDDNGAGFFNYRLGRLLAALEWNRGPWEVQFSHEAARYRWDEQVAGIGLDPPRRQRRDAMDSVQLTRQLPAHWLAFADAERDCVWSNDPAEAYNQTVLSVGLGRKF